MGKVIKIQLTLGSADKARISQHNNINYLDLITSVESCPQNQLGDTVISIASNNNRVLPRLVNINITLYLHTACL